MKVMKHVIKLVNTVRSNALNSNLFRRFREKLDVDRYNLLCHTEVRWLSKGYVLKQFFALRIKLGDFLYS